MAKRNAPKDNALNSFGSEEYERPGSKKNRDHDDMSSGRLSKRWLQNENDADDDDDMFG